MIKRIVILSTSLSLEIYQSSNNGFLIYKRIEKMNEQYKMSFLDRMFFFFSRNDDPELKKIRDLKRITKEISKNKYHEFYKARSKEISPVAGAFFYDIYKSISLFQSCMKNAGKSDMLKQFTVEAFLNKELQYVYKMISPEFIQEHEKTLNSKDLSQHLQEDLNIFSMTLKNKMPVIDRYYNFILVFTEWEELL